MQKRKLIKLAVSIVCLSFTLGVGAAENKKAAMNLEAVKAQKAIDAAEDARKKAASVKGEWRDTGKMIEAAQKALESGDPGKAIKLADEAHKQGDLGYQQAMAQKKLRLPAYFK